MKSAFMCSFAISDCVLAHGGEKKEWGKTLTLLTAIVLLLSTFAALPIRSVQVVISWRDGD